MPPQGFLSLPVVWVSIAGSQAADDLISAHSERLLMLVASTTDGSLWSQPSGPIDIGVPGNFGFNHKCVSLITGPTYSFMPERVDTTKEFLSINSGMRKPAPNGGFYLPKDFFGDNVLRVYGNPMPFYDLDSWVRDALRD